MNTEYKYLKLNKTENGYEYVSRTLGDRGAVVIIPIKKCDNQENKIQLILSLRPTFELPILEFPAGLLDNPEETIEDAALRELREETGWTGEVKYVSKMGCPSSAGLTTEVIYFVIVELHDKIERELQPGEVIHVLPLMTAKKIQEYISKKTHLIVSSRVETYLLRSFELSI